MLKKHKKKQDEISIFDNIPNIKDKILPDSYKENKDYIYLGFNNYYRSFVITIYPDKIYIGWLQELIYIGNINISIKIVPASDVAVVNQLTKKLVQTQAEYAIYEKQGNISHTPELERMIKDLSELRGLIQTNQDKLFLVSIFISLTCESLEELNEKTKILEAEVNKKSAMIRVLSFRQNEGMKEILPINLSFIKNFERNMISGSVATLLPIANPNVSHNVGVFLGNNYYTGAPVYLNSFIGPPQLPNQHIFICGTSGAGKSVALKVISERNILTYGSSAFFIDVEGEYSKIVKALGGKVIKIEQGKTTGINPFELEKDIKGNKEFLNILDKISDIRVLMSTICRNYMGRSLSSTEITEIEIIVRQLYDERNISTSVDSLYEQNKRFTSKRIKKKMPTLTDFQNKLTKRNKCPELAELLIPFLNGGSLGLFDCESSIFSNDDIVSFDLSEIKDEFTKLYASFVILTWTWQKFILKNKEKKKIVVCDEAWIFLKYKESGDFLANVARRGRKFNVSLLIGSQFMDEFLNCDERKSNNKYMCNSFLV